MHTFRFIPLESKVLSDFCIDSYREPEGIWNRTTQIDTIWIDSNVIIRMKLFKLLSCCFCCWCCCCFFLYFLADFNTTTSTSSRTPSTVRTLYITDPNDNERKRFFRIGILLLLPIHRKRRVEANRQIRYTTHLCSFLCRWFDKVPLLVFPFSAWNVIFCCVCLLIQSW